MLRPNKCFVENKDFFFFLNKQLLNMFGNKKNKIILYSISLCCNIHSHILW